MILLFLIFAALLSANSQDFCGVSGKFKGLVVNGTQSERGAWPWLVAIYNLQRNTLICGGTLISSDSVVTAAHCIQDKRVPTMRSPNDIVLKLGRYDLSQNYERGALDAYAHEIYVHPSWKYFNEDFDSDIAVIKLSAPVAFSAVISPICLWSLSEQVLDKSGFIAGFGKSESDAIHENIAHELRITIKSNEECFLRKPELAKISSINTFCAGKDEYSGPCSGDSGSGLYMQHNDRWYLRGIVSSALLDYNRRCDVSNDAVFTNVLKFTDWIKEKADVQLPNVALTQTGFKQSHSFGNKEIVCFVPNWTMYRSDAPFSLNTFKPELCTTAVYMFASLDEDGGIKSFDPYTDLEDNFGLNGFKRFTALKQAYPNLRTLLAIGGWNDGVEKYSKFAANPLKRKGFALQSAEFLQKFGFDGLNFYWDYPGNKERGGTDADKENFVHLLRDISSIYRASGLYLSVSVRAARWVTESAYNLTAIADHVDMINMMTFDHSGGWEKKIGYHAALHKGTSFPSIEESIDVFLEAKVPPSKLTVGIAFYARTFLTSGDGNVGDDNDVSGSVPGPIIKDKTLLGFNEICRMRKERAWYMHYDRQSAQMIGKFIANGRVAVAIFDSPRSVANKVKYAMERNLRGVWAWSVDMDDFEGECEIDETTFEDYGARRPPLYQLRDFPLLRTMNAAMRFLNN